MDGKLEAAPRFIANCNPLFSTSSPYDARCTSGGSSGGEAALLGAAVTSMTIGSDIGGSIRIPAMFCGVFGLKPGPHLTDVSEQLDGSRFCQLDALSALRHTAVLVCRLRGRDVGHRADGAKSRRSAAASQSM